MATSSQAIRVIKLGGSLLDWPELSVRFRRWINLQTPAANVLIVGGGPLVEGLRTIDRAQRLSIEASHWLAIRAMSLTAQIVVELFKEAELIRDLAQVARAPGGPLQVLDVGPVLQEEQASSSALPFGWDVTSDSIAAHIAKRLVPSELVLLKSAIPQSAPSGDIPWADFVDAYFATAAHGLPVRLVNLRSREFDELAINAM